MGKQKAPALQIMALVLLAGLVLAVAPSAGMEWIDPRTVFGNASGMEARIYWDLRVPRVLAAFLAGSSLAACGMAFQALFRNPLATPFTLGVSSGASLGASLAVWAGLHFSILGISSVSLFAFLGALAVVALVWLAAALNRRFNDTPTLLLAGVAVSFFFSSLILFIQYLSDFTQSYQILRWLMGGLEVSGFSSVIPMGIVFLPVMLLFLGLARDLDLLTIDEDLAASRGVETARSKALVYLGTSLLVGTVVAACGPIGFVGMIVPHICRLLVGWNHRALFPACVLLGGSFLAVCDTAAQTLIAPAEIPVGVITAMLGGPFFLWLLFRRSGGRIRR